MQTNIPMGIYESYIHKSRYARYLPELNRREHWAETVERYCSFIFNRVESTHQYQIPQQLKQQIYDYIFSLQVMPSMRAMMTAGKALERDNTAGYNCAYLPVDDPKAFDETMLILMNGTGVGFSVERQYIQKLPEIPDQLFNSDTTIVVKDSKEGWAKALRMLIALLYSGEIPKWDLSKLRPAGAPLKTFGGRSSGPDPLDQMFKFAVRIFSNAKGRKLTSLECHDLMCKIAEVVVVGGVRRSAMISLSNLSDDRMRNCKSGAWWEANVQRALSNNSAVYTEKPEVGAFMEEWLSLYQSKSGERGIFNREAAEKVVKRNGRRDPNHEWGCNPSLRRGTKVWTTEGIFNIEDLQDKTFFVRNLNGKISEAVCWLSGNDKPLYEITLQGGHKYYATKEHKWPVLQKDGTVVKFTSDKLEAGQYFPVSDQIETLTEGTLGNYQDGFVLGWNAGDGWITETPTGKQIGFIVAEHESYIRQIIQNYLVTECDYTGDFLNKEEINVNNQKLRNKFELLGFSHKKNGLPETIWKEASEEFRRGFIDALFSSDGHIESYDDKNGYHRQRICLTSCHEKLIREVSELLGFYGIKTSINIHKKDFYIGANGKKYDKSVVRYTLQINSFTSIQKFKTLFKLSNEQKQNKLNTILEKRLINTNKIKIIDVKLTDLKEDVWDISVRDQTHCFQLAHCITGNCSEIILRPYQFCNLTEVICRETDTEQTLNEKVEIAAILGTFQSTLTNFPYLRKIWQKNTEEERLLGVSLTGIYDSTLLNNYKDSSLSGRLERLRNIAIETNKQYAQLLNIPVSAAATCVKPSGTVSELVNAASGIHPRHDQYYFRRVRSDNKDPLTQILIDAGIPNEPDVTKPQSTTVFTFPKKASDNAIVRNNVSAIDHLELWLVYQEHWCEHKPSVTVSVTEDEWPTVGAWVWQHFDQMSGVSFLPYDGGTYRQAPYEGVTQQQYQELLAKIPTEIDWSKLIEYKDNVEGVQNLACVSGGCDL